MQEPVTGAPRRASPRLAALRLLAARRLTEAQLQARLARKGYDADDVRRAVESCKEDGFIDDGLFAKLYVEGRSKAVGNARLVAELVRRGVAREAALAGVAGAERDQDTRLALAVDKIFRSRTNPTYPSAARALERLGFPASAIYRHLRGHVQSCGWQNSVRETVPDEGS
jgi:SOS response regulatory protein OraA/RecX